MPAKTPAAIKPEKPVARICAQYSNAIRVATSGAHCQLSSNIYVQFTYLYACKKWKACKLRRDRMALP
jgi:hypothetical protein